MLSSDKSHLENSLEKKERLQNKLVAALRASEQRVVELEGELGSVREQLIQADSDLQLAKGVRVQDGRTSTGDSSVSSRDMGSAQMLSDLRMVNSKMHRELKETQRKLRAAEARDEVAHRNKEEVRKKMHQLESQWERDHDTWKKRERVLQDRIDDLERRASLAERLLSDERALRTGGRDTTLMAADSATAAAQKANRSLQSSLERMQEQLDSETAAHALTTQQLSAARERLDTLEADRTEHERYLDPQIKTLRDRLEEALADLASAKQSRDAALRNQADLERSRSELQGQVRRLVEQLRASEEASGKRDDADSLDKRKLQLRAAEAEAKVRALEKDRADAKAHLEQREAGLQRQVEALEARLKDAEGANREWEQRITDMSDKYDSNVRQLEADLSGSRARESDLQIRLDDAAGKLQAAEGAAREWASRMEAAEKAILTQATEKSAIAERDRELAELRELQHSTAEELRRVRLQVAGLESEKHDWARTESELRAALNVARVEAEASAALKSAVRTAEEESSRLRREFSASDASDKSHTAELAALRARLVNVEDEARKWRLESEAAERRCVVYKEAGLKLKAHFKASLHKLKRTSEKVEKTENSLEQVKAAKEDVERALTVSESKRTDAESRLESTLAETRRLQEALSLASSSGAQSGRSQPVSAKPSGIGFGIESTAEDLPLSSTDLGAASWNSAAEDRTVLLGSTRSHIATSTVGAAPSATPGRGVSQPSTESGVSSEGTGSISGTGSAVLGSRSSRRARRSTSPRSSSLPPRVGESGSRSGAASDSEANVGYQVLVKHLREELKRVSHSQAVDRRAARARLQQLGRKLRIERAARREAERIAEELKIELHGKVTLAMRSVIGKRARRVHFLVDQIVHATDATE